MKVKPLKNRDINWLYFNERVLLEAANRDTPLLERLKFLAIFSSNLDEYFKVRISQLRQLKKVDKSLRKKLILKPNKKLKFILKTVSEQQKQFGNIIRDTLNGLREQDIHLKNRNEFNEEQENYVLRFFKENLTSDCEILKSKSPENLKDGQLYLIVQFSEADFEIVSIPSNKHRRFLKIPGEGYQYTYLDDVVKANLNYLFPNKEIQGAFSIKMSRDAELYLEGDYDNIELVEIIYESLGKRKSGQPTRLLYDMNMPEPLIDSLKKELDLGDADMVTGGEYHNLSDFFDFPNPFNENRLSYEPRPPLNHPELSMTDNVFKTISEKDQLVHFPYQKFDVVENFITSAAVDNQVTCIKMSLYRIAKTSVLTDALLKALDHGKKVVLFVEAKARFDEENNIKWGRIFEEKGAHVIFSVPNIKIHSKIALVERNEKDSVKRYAYIGTGNFNAKTAKIYCDHGLFTAHAQITTDLDQVFQVFEKKLIIPKLKYLLVSPFTTRSTFLDLIAQEIENAKNGENAKITLKMNTLEDTKMIGELYKASEAGVEVRLLVRGVCCLVPQGSENIATNGKPIHATSIVDRFLEHGRIYLFENGGDEKMYIGSADWMTRNLDKRIEVLVPILDEYVFNELKDIFQIQLNDNVKARILDENDSNQNIVSKEGHPKIRSQYAIYDYLKEKVDEES